MMDIQKILDDLDLISGVIPDYTAGRRRGLTDAETERIADAAISKAVEVVEAYQEKETPCPPELKVHPKYPALGKDYYCKCGVLLLDYERHPGNYCGRCGQRLRGESQC